MPAAAVEQDVLTDEQVSIVNDNLPLAYKIASESKERRLDFDDLRQAACLGLIEAVQTHDPEKGALSTHAGWCIRAAIQRAARKARPMVSLDGMAEDGVEPAAPSEAKLDDAGLERLRDLMTLWLAAQGWPQRAIAKFFRTSPAAINRRLRGIPPEVVEHYLTVGFDDLL